MAKKIKKKIIKKNTKTIRIVKNPWFKTMKPKHKWGFIPINWKGGIALIILLGLNTFAAKYFNLNYLTFDNWSSFAIVFLLSMAIFVIISKRKTIKNS
ncbi:hypothetical protein KAS08_04010 [Candidatus Pacearchaeota archaeon]|nr:hypothetical protein [Candidatus Pacearchaeota archaeon]